MPLTSSGSSTSSALLARMIVARGVQLPDARPRRRAICSRSRDIDLVDQDRVGHPNVGLTWVIGALVARTQWIGDRDVDVGSVEGQVVVAAVPEQHVAFPCARSRIAP